MLMLFSMAPIHMFQPVVVQRLLMINDNKIASRIMILCGLIKGALIWIMIAIALSALVLTPNLGTKDALLSTITLILPPVIKGFVFVTLIAVLICKADAYLNSSGIIFAQNLLPTSIRTKFGDLTTIRFCTFTISLFAISLALKDFSIAQVIILSESLWGICIGLPIIVGILGLKVNKHIFWLYIYIMLPTFILINLLFTECYAAFIILSISVIVFFLLYYYYVGKNRYKNIFTFKKIYHLLLRYKQRLTIARPSLSALLRYSTQSVNNVGADFYMFGIFFCSIFIPFAMWDFSQPEFLYTTLTLRVTVALLCLLLLLKEAWPLSLQKYFPLYWHICLMIILPFMSFFMLLLQQWSVIWIVSTCLSILLLILLTEWVIFASLTFIGMMLALIIYKIIIADLFIPDNTVNIFFSMTIMFMIIIIGSVFARKKEMINKEKVDITKLLGGTIAHEMRTILLTIGNYANGLNRFLPLLIDTYMADSKKLKSDSISPEQCNSLKHIVSNINVTLKKANSFIDLLLVNITGVNHTYINSYYNLSSCITEALNDYPMSKKERDSIEVDLADDFIIYANKEIVTRIFFNLLNNSIYYFSSLKKPRIQITTSTSHQFNYVHFKDNGPGIKKHDINLIFNKFYSNGKKGSGLGLSFCKISMNLLKGDIICKSVEGHYTEFILSFPKHSIGQE
jgi:signal transduction histidine kinase